MTDRRDTTTHLVALKTLLDAVTKAFNTAKFDALTDRTYRAGDRDMAHLDDGTDDGVQLGHVVAPTPAVRWTVTDKAALLAWVKGHAPSEVRTVEEVSDTYVNALLMQARKQDAPVTDDGEVIPGIESVRGAQSLTVKPAEDALHMLLTEMRAGRFSLDRLPLAAIEDGAA